ncbi:MAG: ribonuclease P protein component [Brooklawnia sp.]|uniref:ribonuclease P protein component n=1 Tax=Brooklawnia sp. TaxID=2699740 RepID=UPI003C75C811
MLPAPFRMRSSRQFEATVRDGSRAGRPTVVVHASRSPATRPDADRVQVGFVVSRKVGNAVTRNRVKRRLRHLAAAQLAQTPGGVCVVVRALPAAATEPGRVPDDVAAAWQASLARLGVGR